MATLGLHSAGSTALLWKATDEKGARVHFRPDAAESGLLLRDGDDDSIRWKLCRSVDLATFKLYLLGIANRIRYAAALAMTVYLMNVWLHLFAAAAWIGSMVFFSAVVVPLLRRAELRATAPVLLRLLGKRYRVFGWIALTTLIVTGLMNLHFRGFTWAVLSQSEFWTHGFGQLLAWKLALVVVVLVMTLMHEKVVGASALDVLQRDPSSARAQRVRRSASWLGRLIGIVSLVILWLAIAMVRGIG